MDHYFLITGAPGSGKTALLPCLRHLGLAAVEEAARQVLAEQRACGGRGTTEQDPARFTQLMLSRAIKHHREHRGREGPVLFDRGLPDVLGYARLFGLPETQAAMAAQAHRYNRTAFLAPPMPQIYRQDEERRMSFEEARAFGEELARGYRDLGYRLVELPAGTPETRCEFILQHVLALTGTAQKKEKRGSPAGRPFLTSRQGLKKVRRSR